MIYAKIEKSKKLEDYFRSNIWNFNKDVTADDIISHFRKNLSKINKLNQVNFQKSVHLGIVMLGNIILQYYFEISAM